VPEQIGDGLFGLLSLFVVKPENEWYPRLTFINYKSKKLFYAMADS